MIAWMLLALLVASSSRCVLWGLMRPERVYQFPTLFGAAWLFYLVPQAIGAISGQDKFPDAVLAEGGLEVALLMSVACVEAAWRGYQDKRWSRPFTAKSWTEAHYSDTRIFVGGVILYAIGMYAAYLLASLAGGFIEQFSGGGHYELEWVGLPVMYVFFANLIYPGMLFVFLALLYKPTFWRALVGILFSLYPLAMTVFLGRRYLTVFILMIVFITLYFVRRWTPPRLAVIAGVVALAGFIVVAPQYRTITQYGFDGEQLKQVQVETSIRDMVRGDEYAEFDGLVLAAAAVNREGTFGLGTSFYNSTIAQLVPRQLVGESFKDSLMLDLWSTPSGSVYADLPYGSNPTGIANAYTEFWFFGALIYYFMAAGMRRLWETALVPSIGGQLWYVILAPLIPVSVVGSLFVLPGQFLGLYFFIALLLWFARLRFAGGVARAA